jgi:uncharacterized membrane protein YvbJ
LVEVIETGERMFCQKCGKENKEGAAFCNACGAPLIPVITSSKDKVIQAKVKTKRDQIEGISQTGPILACLVGLLFLFLGFLFNFLILIFGLILLGIAIWWSSGRENERKKLENEIKELQAEME